MKRLEFLDSLRGLAALYVLIYHLALVPIPALALPDWMAGFVLFGGSGVTLFFVISAFSLCLTMPGHEATGAPLYSFYTKRLLRIAPLFFVLCVLTVLRRYGGLGKLPTVGDVLANLTFLFNLFPGTQDSLTLAGWTIGVEMLFYLVFPALYVVASDLRAKLVACALALLAYQGLRLGLAQADLTDLARARYELMTVLRYIPVFLVGMMAFDLFVHLRARDASWRVGAAFLAVGLVAFGNAAYGWVGDPPYALHFWQTMAYATLLLGAAFCPWTVLVNQATRFLGEISYSVYLWHIPVIIQIRGVLRGIYGLGLPSGAAFLLCLAVTLAVVVPLSWLSYRFIERPGIEWARKLVATRATRRRLAPQPG